jgi:poly-gamma-glutamate synthesis protein (capsule biosynthesis protein)
MINQRVMTNPSSQMEERMNRWPDRAVSLFAKLLLSAVIACFAAACGDMSSTDGGSEIRQDDGNGGTTDMDAAGEDRTPSGSPEPAPPAEPEPYTLEADLVAVGDIMMHSPQLTGAYDPETRSYSFAAYFPEVKHLLQGDWVFANLETPIAGEDLNGFSGYPMFNAPEALADAIREAGFNVVSTANNHTMDRREQGVLRTLENVRSRGIATVGTHMSAEEAEQVLIMEKNGIRMAFLAYTYGTNGIPVPEDKPYLVNLIDEERIVADIAKASQAGADVVTVSMHFGNEYQRQPSEEQKRLARRLIEAGADIVLGSHPHVVQPYEWVETSGADGTPRKGLVMYSLGNFISNQGPDQGTAKYTDVGVIFRVQVRKHMPEGVVEIGEVTAEPTWVHKYREGGRRQYRVLPIASVLKEQNDAILTDQHYRMLEDYLTEMTAHIQSMAVPAEAQTEASRP